jgi:hypothetical protein
MLSACASRAVNDLCNDADGNGQSTDSVETWLTAAVCFAYRPLAGHEDYKFPKQKRQPVMVGVA